MKKINSSLCSIFMLLFCVFSVQTALAVDVPLKKDDPTGGNMMMTRSTITTIPVSVSLNDTELVVSFGKSVGVAQLSVVDATGAVVYQESVDTNSTPQTYIEVGGFDSGNYVLKITYGTTSLKGAFQL
jgi:Protein of unknown function (DUF3244).